VKNVYGEIAPRRTCAVTNRASRRPSSARVERGLGRTACCGHGLGVVRLAAVADRRPCRRLEIPDEMQKKHSFKALGTADGK